eukprot:Skav203807  [mRNA]  locus=scaffold1236:226763:231325:+ [translate_table: standard]
MRIPSRGQPVRQEQAKDTVDQLEEFGLAVKAEPIEGERSNEQDSLGDNSATSQPIPKQSWGIVTKNSREYRLCIAQASETLRRISQEIRPDDMNKGDDSEFDRYVEMVRHLRSELRAAAKGLEEHKQRRGAQLRSFQVLLCEG